MSGFDHYRAGGDDSLEAQWQRERDAVSDAPNDRVTWTPEEVARVRLEERLRGVEEGRAAERARVARIRDACFAGLVLDDPKVREAIERFDGMLLRGEDVAS